jgi:hypothetical protein
MTEWQEEVRWWGRIVYRDRKTIYTRPWNSAQVSELKMREGPSILFVKTQFVLLPFNCYALILYVVYSSSVLIKETWQESSEEQIAAWNFLMLDKNKNKVWILNSTYSPLVIWHLYNDLQLYKLYLASNIWNYTRYWLTPHFSVFFCIMNNMNVVAKKIQATSIIIWIYNSISFQYIFFRLMNVPVHSHQMFPCFPLSVSCRVWITTKSDTLNGVCGYAYVFHFPCPVECKWTA